MLSTGPDRTAFAGWLLAGADYLAQARVRHPGHRKFVGQETLSQGGDDASGLRITAGPDGRATAVWKRADRIQTAKFVP